MTLLKKFLLANLCLLFFYGLSLRAQTFPPNFNASVFKTGWTLVEGICFDSTGQMYVWEKEGVIWVVDTLGVKQTTPLLDIHAEVGGWRDHGLNGFALDPNFRTNGYYYLFYTVDRHHLLYYGTPQYDSLANEYYNATIARVTRYTANPASNFKTTLPGSRLLLIGENKKTGIPVLHESHSGGQLLFGRDGSLLISTGDGASYGFPDGGGGATYWSQALTDSIIPAKENVGGFRAQMLSSLNGKILRVDPATGNGIPSNPYYNASQPRSANSRVWCLGLRNPFRMCIRPATGSTGMTNGNPGSLYIGDVGWTIWEDLNVATGPAINFGWPLFEGLTPMPTYQAIDAYNADAPNPLYGTGGCTQPNFLFRKLCIQDTNTTTPSFPNPCNAAVQIPSNIPRFKQTGPVVDWRHNTPVAQTRIWNGTSAVQINLDDPLSPVQGPIFMGNASVGGVWYNGNKYSSAYQNTYFHGDYGAGWIKNFVFNSSDIPVSVSDFGSGVGSIVCMAVNPHDGLIYYVKYPSDIMRLNYTANSPPIALASQDTSYGAAPLPVHFTGSNSYDPENFLITYQWSFGDGGISTVANPVHTYSPGVTYPVTYTVTLTVTDNIGQTSTATLKVYLNNTPPQVTITSFHNGDLFTMSHNTILPLQASVYDAQSPNSQLLYSWQTILHHNNHEHPELPDNDSVTSTVLTPIGCDTVDIYNYRIQLTVTDPQGLSTTVSSTLYPACDPPVADFRADMTTICESSTVNFIDKSSNLPDSWQWTFQGGNPSGSVLQNPSVKYSQPGTYDITLTSTSSRGSGSLVKTGFITVNNNPAISIVPAANDTVCIGSPVLLTALSGNKVNFQWIRNDVDIPGANGQTYTTNNAGKYRVKATKYQTGCYRISQVKKIFNRATDTPVITANGPTTFCPGDSVILSTPFIPGNSYQWLKNNKNISSKVTAAYVAKTYGTYKVNVTNGYGCSKVSDKVKINIDCGINQRDIEGDDLSADAYIYPNPAENKITLNIFAGDAGSVAIKIFDILGIEHAGFSQIGHVDPGNNEFEIDVASFAPGIYSVQINSQVSTITLKLVIKD